MEGSALSCCPSRGIEGIDALLIDRRSRGAGLWLAPFPIQAIVKEAALKPLSLQVRKAAVLGSGVMGAQIAAHMANAHVPVVLFDLAAKEGDPSGIARKAIESLKRLEPSPLAAKNRADYIDAANYDEHLETLAGCDLVIEAISERMDWKKALYEKVAPHIGSHAIFATNTSGLSINALAQACPPSIRPRFCGIHFFNPPRYMHLVELIAQK